MKRLKMQIRIGAEHDEVIVTSPAGTVTVDRATMTGPEKLALRHQLVETWKQVAGQSAMPRRQRRRRAHHTPGKAV